MERGMPAHKWAQGRRGIYDHVQRRRENRDNRGIFPFGFGGSRACAHTPKRFFFYSGDEISGCILEGPLSSSPGILWIFSFIWEKVISFVSFCLGDFAELSYFFLSWIIAKKKTFGAESKVGLEKNKANWTSEVKSDDIKRQKEEEKSGFSPQSTRFRRRKFVRAQWASDFLLHPRKKSTEMNSIVWGIKRRDENFNHWGNLTNFREIFSHSGRTSVMIKSEKPLVCTSLLRRNGPRTSQRRDYPRTSSHAQEGLRSFSVSQIETVIGVHFSLERGEELVQ